MKEYIKTITALPLFMVAMTFTGCSSNESQQITGQHEASSETETKSNHVITEEESIQYYNHHLSITGEVENPLILTVDSLKQMNVVTFDSLNIVCQSGALMNQSNNSRGVLLKDILNKAGIIQKSHSDRNFYIVARASDGYKATFSWAELFNNPTGEHTYIIFEENNQPITKKGAMVLNCNNDIRTGPRQVNWLKSVEVYRVD